MKNKYLSGLCVFFLSIAATSCAQPPRLTIILIIDQFGYSFVEKLKEHFKHGLKTIYFDGVKYTKAYYPHANPTTGAGHTGMSTGTYAKNHGIISNWWFDEHGKRVASFDDASVKTFGREKAGESAKNILSATLTDAFITADPQHNHAWSVSLKSRAAIPAAGKRGKAIWFDGTIGVFTSSTAYFKQLPTWLNEFNQKEGLPVSKLSWQLVYPKNDAAYDFKHIDNYDHSAMPSLISRTVTIDRKDKKPYNIFTKYPQTNKILLDLAQECIDKSLSDENQRLLLWISLSSLDKAGHYFGPHTRESIDTIYHIDKLLTGFLDYAWKKAGKENTLIIVSGDHGIVPIPEMARLEGKEAYRPDLDQLIREMNSLVKENYGFEKFIQNYDPPRFYFDKKIVATLDENTIKSITRDLKKLLKKKKYIHDVWTQKELTQGKFKEWSMKYMFQQQIYPGRSGDLFVYTKPNTILSKYKIGTTHEFPDRSNRHVPLIVYQPGRFENKLITRKKVSILQVTNTLAEILGIPKLPEPAVQKVLPGLGL